MPNKNTRETILVLDDEPDIKKIINLIKLVLNANPASDDPEEQACVQRISDIVTGHCRPDVIKLDINIPGLDAAAIFERIRNDSQFRSIATHLDRRGV